MQLNAAQWEALTLLTAAASADGSPWVTEMSGGCRSYRRPPASLPHDVLTLQSPADVLAVHGDASRISASVVTLVSSFFAVR